MTRFNILLAAALMSFPVASFGQSVEPIIVTEQLDTAIVSYADLNLASHTGKRMLDRRISGAIEQVCGSFANVREATEEDRIVECRRAARTSAEHQLAERPVGNRVALNVKR